MKASARHFSIMNRTLFIYIYIYIATQRRFRIKKDKFLLVLIYLLLKHEVWDRGVSILTFTGLVDNM